MMSNKLLETLTEIKDPRRGEGVRHPLPLVLIIVLMATMSGYFGYRGIGDFVIRNRKELLKYFKPKKNRLPSFSKNNNHLLFCERCITQVSNFISCNSIQ